MKTFLICGIDGCGLLPEHGGDHRPRPPLTLESLPAPAQCDGQAFHGRPCALLAGHMGACASRHDLTAVDIRPAVDYSEMERRRMAMLFQDPRSLPTAPQRWTPRPWVQQVVVKQAQQEVVRRDSDFTLLSVACLSEPELETRLIILVGSTGQRLELPMVHLARMYPAALKLEAAIFVDRRSDLAVTLYGAEQAYVVLSGTETP